MGKLSTCLWFDGHAEEASQFYRSIFKNSTLGATARYTAASAQVSGQPKDAVMTVEFSVEEQKILALNGGPLFKFSPATSYTVYCETETEIDDFWQKLSDGGKVRMEIDAYPWSKRYGWTADKFGVDWQLILSPNRQKIVPTLLFVDKVFGKAEQAIDFYREIFPSSKVLSMTKDEKANSIMHCLFSLDAQEFVIMDGMGTHNFTFTEAFSIVVSCKDQQEIDHYYLKLSAGGSQDPCGWVKDKFGISWQIVPDFMSEIMADSRKSEQVMEVLIKMKKPDLQAIKKAIGRT